MTKKDDLLTGAIDRLLRTAPNKIGVRLPRTGGIIQAPTREIDAGIVGQRMQPVTRGAGSKDNRDGGKSDGKSGDDKK